MNFLGKAAKFGGQAMWVVTTTYAYPSLSSRSFALHFQLLIIDRSNLNSQFSIRRTFVTLVPALIALAGEANHEEIERLMKATGRI
jgi:hypothetical protein